VDERTIFCALGATAHPRPGGLTGQYERMPRVTAPEESPPLRHGPRAPEVREAGFNRNLEFREAEFEDDVGPGCVGLWARLTTGSDVTRAGIAYLADMVPMAVARGAGKMGAGFSLDNSLRFATIPPTEWVLIELRGQVAAHGYGHGSLTAWASDGTLMATASQTASMTYMFDPGDEAAVAKWRQAVADSAAH
jgi:acyl-CoA thioesterase II